MLKLKDKIRTPIIIKSKTLQLISSEINMPIKAIITIIKAREQSIFYST
jgi:hypothetical protein